MKKYLLYIIIALGATMSCSDFLDKKSPDIITNVWNIKEGVTSNMVTLYNNMQTEDFGYTIITEAGYPSQITDEAVRSYTWGDMNLPIIPDGIVGWWGYSAVRTVNEFIEYLPQGSLDKPFIDAHILEARFIRAFYYFSMVKRYGGMPIIEDAQAISTNMGSLQVPRNTEKESYDFILKELDDIIPNMPKVNPYGKFRANKYTALALKSRAMLYAASVATYGTVDKNGLVGIPIADKDFYWNESKKASAEIIGSTQYSLYKKDADKEVNFQNLFLDTDLHSEAIFAKAFRAPDKGHSFDFYNAAMSFRVDYGCATNPVLEIVEDFDYIDGSPGILKTEDASGNPIPYADPKDVFKDKDPRMHATILTPFAAWQGNIVEVRKGIIDGTKVITAGDLKTTYGEKGKEIPITGKDGPLDTWDPTKTGFYIKKFMHPQNRLPSNRSETNWMIFRYAEILLNYAEACVELNQNVDSALIVVNQIRSRAGIAEHTSIDMEKIRKERKVELAFENHRWWDIRRWRVATSVLDNKVFYSLNPYLVWEADKHHSEMKYIFKKERAPKNTRTFLPRLYYEKIPSGQISTNPKLVQNPGY